MSDGSAQLVRVATFQRLDPVSHEVLETRVFPPGTDLFIWRCVSGNVRARVKGSLFWLDLDPDAFVLAGS